MTFHNLLLVLCALVVLYVVCVALKYALKTCFIIVLGFTWLALAYQHGGESAVVVAFVILPVLPSLCHSVGDRLANLTVSSKTVPVVPVSDDQPTDVDYFVHSGEWIPGTKPGHGLQVAEFNIDELPKLNTWL